MIGYIAQRLLLLVPTLVGVVTVVFLLLRLIPGDPAEFIMGDYATKEGLALLRAQMGLDLPLYKQYGIFILNWAQGDMGRSLISGQPALKEVLSVFPYSIHLATAGMFIAALVGIPLGIISAIRQNTLVDYSAMAQAIREFVQAGQFQLLETLARRLADHVGQRFGLERLHLHIRKPEAIEDSGGAAVSLEWQRGQEREP